MNAAAQSLDGGFAVPSTQSAHAFRAILDALSRPGTIHTLQGAAPPEPMSRAAGAVLLTLCDATTPLHLAGAHDCAALRNWITFHCAAPLVAADQAMFALGTWQALLPVSRFAIGLPDYPDRATTLIVEMTSVQPTGAALRGPGIERLAHLNLPETAAFQANRALFPLGFDCLFTAGQHIAGLARSTIVEEI
jgi:alpha-D-ribose 1-methylphosphonate 5-triphosphate synthase subunit PhnH